jgi:hypothetical protein
MRFQRRAGLAVDGILGLRTRAALGRYARHRLGSRPLRRGAAGWDVATLQSSSPGTASPPGRSTASSGPGRTPPSAATSAGAGSRATGSPAR